MGVAQIWTSARDSRFRRQILFVMRKIPGAIVALAMICFRPTSLQRVGLMLFRDRIHGLPSVCLDRPHDSSLHIDLGPIVLL
jgi:hypothetical protein